MPDSTDLPAGFGNFAHLNAAEVATGREFRNQMDRLIAAIERAVTGTQAVSPVRGHQLRGGGAPHQGFGSETYCRISRHRWC